MLMEGKANMVLGIKLSPFHLFCKIYCKVIDSEILADLNGVTVLEIMFEDYS